MHVQVMDYAAPSRARQVRLWVWVMAGLTFACLLVASMPFMQLALEAFRCETGRFPTAAEALSALVTRPADVANWGGPYLRARDFRLSDPWGRLYVYTPPATQSGRPVVTSPGPDGKAGTGDDVVAGP